MMEQKWNLLPIMLTPAPRWEWKVFIFITVLSSSSQGAVAVNRWLELGPEAFNDAWSAEVPEIASYELTWGPGNDLAMTAQSSEWVNLASWLVS